MTLYNTRAQELLFRVLSNGGALLLFFEWGWGGCLVRSRLSGRARLRWCYISRRPQQWWECTQQTTTTAPRMLCARARLLPTPCCNSQQTKKKPKTERGRGQKKVNTKRRAKKMGAALSSLAHSKKLKERERQKEGGGRPGSCKRPTHRTRGGGDEASFECSRGRARRAAKRRSTATPSQGSGQRAGRCARDASKRVKRGGGARCLGEGPTQQHARLLLKKRGGKGVCTAKQEGVVSVE